MTQAARTADGRPPSRGRPWVRRLLAGAALGLGSAAAWVALAGPAAADEATPVEPAVVTGAETADAGPTSADTAPAATAATDPAPADSAVATYTVAEPPPADTVPEAPPAEEPPPAAADAPPAGEATTVDPATSVSQPAGTTAANTATETTTITTSEATASSPAVPSTTAASTPVIAATDAAAVVTTVPAVVDVPATVDVAARTDVAAPAAAAPICSPDSDPSVGRPRATAGRGDVRPTALTQREVIEPPAPTTPATLPLLDATSSAPTAPAPLPIPGTPDAPIAVPAPCAPSGGAAHGQTATGPGTAVVVLTPDVPALAAGTATARTLAAVAPVVVRDGAPGSRPA